jgi:spore coat polysaccharide biosynthesis predicted glycosyltransferase SpsG
VSVGFGHVRRTLTLADELRSRGHRVSIASISSEATRLIPPQPPFTEEAAVLVVDAHKGVADAIVTARAEGKIVVALDWFGDAEPDIAVVVYPHAAVRARLQAFVGYEYCMLRPEIIAQPAASDGEGAVVALGGGDILRQAHAAAQGLSASGMDVSVIQGPLATPEGPRGPYRVVNNPPDFPARLSRCALAVTNAGGCMFEALYFGRPTHVLPQTSMEWAVADDLRRRGLLLGVGVESLRTYGRTELSKYMTTGNVLVDGSGARRIAAIVEGLL